MSFRQIRHGRVLKWNVVGKQWTKVKDATKGKALFLDDTIRKAENWWLTSQIHPWVILANKILFISKICFLEFFLEANFAR